jgi:alkyl sulfatase BDS1-like metallo-beta-lactamase superfamily hydrolase
MSIELFLNFLGIRIDSRKAEELRFSVNRSDLEQTMMGAKTPEDQIKDVPAKVEGDVRILAKLAATMGDFDPRFEMQESGKTA